MKKSFTKWTALLLTLMPAMAYAQYQGYSQVWSDEFNGGYSNADATTGLDLDCWNFETGNGDGGWGTGQRDYATKDKANVEVSNGTLKIRTQRNYAGQGREYTSGRLNTKDKKSFLYGKIEARIRTNNMTEKGRGFAFWLMPNGIPSGYSSVAWPQGGEIDIFEYNGMYPEYNLGSVHYCWGWNDNKWAGQGQHAQASNVYFATDRTKKFNSAGRDGCTGNNSMTQNKNNLLGADWHVYGVNWYSNRIEFYVDQDVYHIFRIDYEAWCGDFNLVNNKMQVTTGWNYATKGYDTYWRTFENPFYIILSAGVGGANTYGGNITDGNNPNQWTCTTEIDWVRCYKLDAANPPQISLACSEKQGQVTVTPTVKSGAAISKIEYIVDKVPVASTKTANPYTYTFTPTTTSHMIYARACNADGYWGNWANVRYIEGGGEIGDCDNNFGAYSGTRDTYCNNNYSTCGQDNVLTASGRTLTANITTARYYHWLVASGLDIPVTNGHTYQFSGKVKATNNSTITLCIEKRGDTDKKMFTNTTLNLTANQEKTFNLSAKATFDMLQPDLSIAITNGPANTTYTITELVLKRTDCDPTEILEALPSYQEFKVYPNPVNDFVNVESPIEISNIMIVGIDGRVIYNEEINKHYSQVDMSSAPKGMYILRASFADGSTTDSKLIK